MSILERNEQPDFTMRPGSRAIIQRQSPSLKLGDGGVIGQVRQRQWQRRGGVHPKLEGWQGSWRRQRRCLYPPHLRVAVSMRIRREKKKKGNMRQTDRGGGGEARVLEGRDAHVGPVGY